MSKTNETQDFSFWGDGIDRLLSISVMKYDKTLGNYI